MTIVNVLFVCLGNICRSPTAHGVFQKLVDDAGFSEKIFVDSAGTSGWHIGEPPDKRASAAALKRGYNLSALRGRQLTQSDFADFNYILAMDSDNLANIKALRPANYNGEVDLLLNYAKNSSITEVPDPYYGGSQGFEHVLDLVEDACRSLLEDIQQKLS